jgi:hypothetical protein
MTFVITLVLLAAVVYLLAELYRRWFLSFEDGESTHTMFGLREWLEH